MSKVSSVDYPKYTGGQVSINNTPVSQSKMANGLVSSNYNMSDGEKAIYDYAQGTLVNILPQVNTFLPETLSSLQSQIDAYTNQGTKTIDNVYSPMLKNLQNDIASRFGNFDNSMFMDNLNSIESKRGDAISAFAQDIMAKNSELVNNELKNRYAYIDLLNTMQNQPMQNALSYMNMAQGISNNANSYNNNLYNALNKQSNSSQVGMNQLASYLASTIGPMAGGI